MIFRLVIPFAVGLGLGVINYTSLWLTVLNLFKTKHPALLSMSSYIIRMGFTLAGFYIIMDGRWERLCAAMAGFFLIRIVLTWHMLPARINDKTTMKVRGT